MSLHDEFLQSSPFFFIYVVLQCVPITFPLIPRPLRSAGHPYRLAGWCSYSYGHTLRALHGDCERPTALPKRRCRRSGAFKKVVCEVWSRIGGWADVLRMPGGQAEA